MYMDRIQRALEAAATETLERIHRDRQRAPARIKPLLQYLEEHIFDPGLDVNQLKRACGVRDNALPLEFHTALDLPPYAYIEDCRMETACRLLRDSDLKVWQITQVLGYSSIQVFSRAFERWSGIRPTAFRRRSRQEPGGELPAAQRSPDSLLGDRPLRVETLRQALEGTLQPSEAGAVILRLLKLYPDTVASLRSPLPPTPVDVTDPGRPRRTTALDSAPVPADASKDGIEILSGLLTPQDVAVIQAEVVSREIQRRALPEQWELVHGLLNQPISTAFFDRMSEECRQLSNVDVEPGRKLAELALRALDAIDPARAEETLHANLKARAWGDLANARRLAMDHAGAEEAFAAAEQSLPSAGEDPLIRADIWRQKANLRWHQRCFDDALLLVENALSLYRLYDDKRRTGIALISKAIFHSEVGELETAIPCLQEALPLVESARDSQLQCSVYFELVRCYALLGRVGEAADLLQLLRHHIEPLDCQNYRARLSWLEGLVAREQQQPEVAKAKFLEARDGMVALKRYGDAAMFSLDLAVLHASEGNRAEVLHLVSEAIPLFESLKLSRETVAALNLLRQAVEMKEVDGLLIDHVRTALTQPPRQRRTADSP